MMLTTKNSLPISLTVGWMAARLIARKLSVSILACRRCKVTSLSSRGLYGNAERIGGKHLDDRWVMWIEWNP